MELTDAFRGDARSLACGPDRCGAMRLLLVEDNIDLARLTGKALVKAGFEIDSTGLAADASQFIASGAYSAIILDLGLPDGSGLALLKSMRARSDATPVIVLTARGTIYDRVLGLQTGADDYLIKPFAMEELVARVRALLRRPTNYLGRLFTAGNVAFDPIGRQLYITGEPQFLSGRELALLEVMMARVGRVVPKPFVEARLFGTSDDVHSNAVEVYVHRLRKQLEELGATVEIHTIRGVGYLLTERKS
jgi:DNA-binding response OmpR family regulator